MNSSVDPKAVLEQAVDKLEHTPASKEKHALAQKASGLHQTITGHPMQFDKDDNLITSGPEADQCPALHHDKLE
ncbi:hypothetical protein BDA99DRAFT_460813 [Phascolomyces articulosus]|uniref:Uncharacterized protein n=1 Tax=Phascolomyces articulosus TaxID=60185 RepID=A0AAD5K512_9FUNG|nr:hypothetical protein BDA99DRAFT_460813 [Phascolomyces articulosus]